MHIMRNLALVAGLLLASSASAQQAAAQRAEALTQEQITASSDVQSLGRLAGMYQQMGDKDRYRWAMKRLTEILPGNLKLKLDLAASYAADDMKTPAYDILLRMKGEGFGIDIAKDPRFTKIHGTEVWDFIVQSLEVNLKPFGKGKVAWTLPSADLLVDALAWDSARKQLLVGSARDGGIYRVGKDGKLVPFITADAKNQLWSIFALAADAQHNRLWVATTSVVYFKGFAPDNAAKAALVEFDLRSGKLIQRYPLETLGTPFMSALALAPDGTVYAVDGVNKVIYTVAKGKLEQLVANPHLNDIRAITVSGDGKILYLADTLYGILGYDLDKKQAFGLQYNPEGLVLPGVTGIHWYDGTLVLVEPGMQPQRIMRLTLSKDGRGVSKAMPLDVAQPEFKQLGAATIAGDQLYVVANSQRTKYNSRGSLQEGATLDALQIWQSNLRFAWNEGGVDLGMKPIPTAKQAGAKPPLSVPPALQKP